jgi:hypothetical protein
VTVDELQERMSSHEFSEWQAFARLEPFGPLTDWERTGILATQVTNVAAGKLVVKPSDFIPPEPEFEPEPEPEPSESSMTEDQRNLKARINTALREAFKMGG